ncbi:hypothetical protein DL93DRAFT_2073732 [Clavulina sp. PMI_390]|nr:hypothetical protein DL93DRAFT_2073732 [Clavulina sp. PMI_390]
MYYSSFSQGQSSRAVRWGPDYVIPQSDNEAFRSRPVLAPATTSPQAIPRPNASSSRAPRPLTLPPNARINLPPPASLAGMYSASSKLTDNELSESLSKLPPPKKEPPQGKRLQKRRSEAANVSKAAPRKEAVVPSLPPPYVSAPPQPTQPQSRKGAVASNIPPASTAPQPAPPPSRKAIVTSSPLPPPISTAAQPAPPPPPQVTPKTILKSGPDTHRATKDQRLAEHVQAALDWQDVETLRIILAIAEQEQMIASDAALARRVQARYEEEARQKAAEKPSRSEDRQPAPPPRPTISREQIEQIVRALIKTQDYRTMTRPTSTARCMICTERFTVVPSPAFELRHNGPQPGRPAIGSQPGLPTLLGTKLSCPERHAFCTNCLCRYVQGKFDAARLPKKVFPIGCPGCTETVWPISDQDADRILPYAMLQQWKDLKYQDENFLMFCPNPRCSVPLVGAAPTGGKIMAKCGACRTYVCIACKTSFHSGITCARYQALPEEEKNPDDRKVIALAKKKNWRNCPKCKRLIELSAGCRHVTCPCGTSFCFNCVSLWDSERNRCSKNPPCDLWSEEELLRPRADRGQPRADGDGERDAARNRRAQGRGRDSRAHASGSGSGVVARLFHLSLVE